MRSRLLAFFLGCALALAPLAQAQTTGSSATIAQLQQQIAQLQQQINAANAQKKTLQSAINSLNLNIQKTQTSVTLTQAQIKQKDSQISDLTTNISTTSSAVVEMEQAVADSMRQLNQADRVPLLGVLLSEQSLSSFFNDAEEVMTLRDSLETNIFQLTTLKTNLESSKTQAQAKRADLAVLEATLAAQQKTLNQTKTSKTQLLQETDAQESTYEQLLSQAQAQLASFSAFTQNAGGAGLLTNQTSCDSWGCYYNQRDAQWGNMPLNGTQYLMKSDGCLVTAVAMVMTHLGYRDVTPVTINSNPSNFAAYEPAYLLFTINVDGVSATRVTATINATLAKGTPVIVGLHAYGGTHFVVLTKGNSASTYLMRDPYVSNGDDVSFSAHYSFSSIYSIQKVVVSS